MTKIKRALYFGRFQPFHNGHLEIIKQIMNEVDELIIMIAAAQYSHSIKNPFTASERYQMIYHTLLQEYGYHRLGKIHLIPAFDINDNALWVTHLERLLPPFHVVYSNNPFTTRLFQEKGYTVKQTPMIKRAMYSGEKIRQRLLQNQSITDLVPQPVAELVTQFHGKERVQAARTSDEEDPKNR